MSYLLDTCVISDFFKKIPSVISRFQQLSPEEMNVSSISVMEIEYGLHLHPEKEKKIRPLWKELLKHIHILPYSPLCAEISAFLRADLKNKGLPIGPYDILLAGTALAHRLTMVTSNIGEFNRIKELVVEDWR